METKKINVWALYDDALMCYYNALKQDKRFNLISVGINDIKNIKNYYKIDLSITNFNLISELKKIPIKPDIILASPPCESWSIADCGGRQILDINNNIWKINNKQYYNEYNIKAHKVKKRYFEQKEKTRILGESTAFASIEIIKYFKPKVWIIENPQTSLIWKYFKKHCDFKGEDNISYYYSYDENLSKKATNFFSNVKLILKTNKVKGNKNYLNNCSYNDRSKIPEKLINDFINQVLEIKF